MYSEAMSHAALLLALDDSAGTRYSANEGAAPCVADRRQYYTSSQFMDMFTDAPVATLWFRQYQSNSCLWNGEQHCEIYLRQFILITVATLLAL
jgi:hypothetical protein